MTPEGKVKNKVREILKSLKAYYIMPATGGYGSSGAPDFVVCYKGRFMGIECTAEGNKPTALQEKNLQGIRATRGFAYVVNEDNVSMLREIMEVDTL